MPTARGDRAAFLMRQQANFATPAAAGAGLFRLMPFYQLNFAPTEEVTEDDAIVGDAFPGAAVAGLRNLTGNIEVPLGIQSIGWHLRGLFGAPVTSGSSPNYSHVFSAAAQPVPLLYTSGISHRGADIHFRQAPIAYTGLRLNAKKDGLRVRARFDMLGSVETKLGATLDATPVEYANDRVPVGFQGQVLLGGTPVAGVTACDITAGLGLTPDQEELNGLPTAASFLDGSWSVTGSLSARFTDTSWYDLGDAGTLQDLELRFQVAANESLVLRAHNLRFERTGIPIQGGDVLTGTFNFRGSRPASGDTPLRVTLLNQTATYANPS